MFIFNASYLFYLWKTHFKIEIQREIMSSVDGSKPVELILDCNQSNLCAFSKFP